MAVRRLYEPLCIAFGTTVSSPTVPTYQLYDLPHKFTPRLYMESEDPNLVLREIGVWAGWEQAGSANTRSFLLDLLKDEDAHDNFLVREAGGITRAESAIRFGSVVISGVGSFIGDVGNTLACGHRHRIRGCTTANTVQRARRRH